MPNKAMKPKTMEELLASLPKTGITSGKDSNESAEFVAAHPETWVPVVQGTRGRPRRGEETGSKTKSIRFPDDVWMAMEAKAKGMNLSLHAAIRKALLDWAKEKPGAPQARHIDTNTQIQTIVVLTPSIDLNQPQSTSWAESDAKSYGQFLNIGQGSILPSRSKN